MELKYLNENPEIHSSVYVEESAQIIGDVKIGKDSSVWFNAVIRGDVHYIRIGQRNSIQDGCLLHVTRDIYPLVLEDDITVGHGVILHGCTIKSKCLIGMGAIILDNAEVGEGSIIAAGTVVREGAKIPPRSLVAGVPGIVKRPTTDNELRKIMRSSQNYLGYKDAYFRKQNK